MIETPYDLDAVRALDDDRLWQFCVLLEDWGPRVATAWLSRWRNGGIDATNRNPGVCAPGPVTCEFDRGVTRTTAPTGVLSPKRPSVVKGGLCSSRTRRLDS